MPKKHVFMSFDFDHDSDLPVMLAGQAKLPDSPFDLVDKSLKEPLTGDWKSKIRPRIRNADLVVVICGQYTDTAVGVSAELQIAQEIGKPYFLLWGRKDKICVKPTAAKSNDKIYKWEWDTLKQLIGGAR
jgi:hypothetical protein